MQHRLELPLIWRGMDDCPRTGHRHSRIGKLAMRFRFACRLHGRCFKVPCAARRTCICHVLLSCRPSCPLAPFAHGHVECRSPSDRQRPLWLFSSRQALYHFRAVSATAFYSDPCGKRRPAQGVAGNVEGDGAKVDILLLDRGMPTLLQGGYPFSRQGGNRVFAWHLGGGGLQFRFKNPSRPFNGS